MVRFLLVLACCITTVCTAQPDYPAKPIRIINPYSPGGGSDVVTRSLGEALRERIKQPIVVESRAGASGMIGANACKNSPPDGYTFCILLSDILVINPYIYKNISYTNADFLPITSLVNIDALVLARQKLSANNLTELVAEAKKPGSKLTWGTHGIGSSSHLLMEKMNQSQKIDLTNVPYQGSTPANVAVLADQVDVTMTAYGLVAQHIAKGSMKPLGVLGKSRVALLPGVPTLSEQGIDFKGQLWYGLFAPKGTPEAIVQLINREINVILQDPNFVAKSLAPLGFSPSGSTPAELADRVRVDSLEWGGLAKSLNLNLD